MKNSGLYLINVILVVGWSWIWRRLMGQQLSPGVESDKTSSHVSLNFFSRLGPINAFS